MRGKDTHAVLRIKERAQTGSGSATGRGRGGERRRQTTVPGGAEIRDVIVLRQCSSENCV